MSKVEFKPVTRTIADAFKAHATKGEEGLIAVDDAAFIAAVAPEIGASVEDFKKVQKAAGMLMEGSRLGFGEMAVEMNKADGTETANAAFKVGPVKFGFNYSATKEMRNPATGNTETKHNYVTAKNQFVKTSSKEHKQITEHLANFKPA